MFCPFYELCMGFILDDMKQSFIVKGCSESTAALLHNMILFMPEVDHVERRLHIANCAKGCSGFPVADVHKRKDVNMQEIIAKNGSETLEPVKAQVKGKFMN